MPKFKVTLPYTERVIEAEDEDKADDIFRDDETIFYAIETERMEEKCACAPMVAGTNPACPVHGLPKERA